MSHSQFGPLAAEVRVLGFDATTLFVRPINEEEAARPMEELVAETAHEARPC